MPVCCTCLLLSHLVPLQVKTPWRKCLSFFPLKAECLLSRVNLRNTKRLSCTLKLTDTISQDSHSLFSCCCFPYENEIIPWTPKWNLVTNGGQTFVSSDFFPQLAVPKPASSVLTVLLYAQNYVYCSKEPHVDCWPDNFFTCLPLCRGTASASLLLDRKQFPQI